MTSFAPVGPLSILRTLPSSLGDYHLLIAPKILEAEDEYRAFFGNFDQFVIVDNGVIELGYPLDVRDLYRAASIVHADVVILPDTIDDSRMTIKQARQNVPAFQQLDPGVSLMGVVQGKTFMECMECATGLRDAGVDWLGVPRGLTPNLGSRVELVKVLGDTFRKPMHVLGFSENIADDIAAASAHRLVKGLDAATPLWYGMDPLWSIFPPAAPTEAGYGRRPTDYWQRPDRASFAAEHNVLTVRQWLSDASLARIGKVAPVDLADLTPHG